MMRRFLFCSLLACGLGPAVIPNALAQSCGPACPDCSGGGAGRVLPAGTIVGSALLIPDGDDETAVYNLSVSPSDWLTVGAGYAVEAEEEFWSVRLRVFPEKGWRPEMLLGTGSVQAGGSDQSAYVQWGKCFGIYESVELGLMGGYATDMPDFEEDFGLGQVRLTLVETLSPFYLYDGVTSHVGATWHATTWLDLTGYVLEMDTAAAAIALKWEFGSGLF